MVFACAYLGHQ